MLNTTTAVFCDQRWCSRQAVRKVPLTRLPTVTCHNTGTAVRTSNVSVTSRPVVILLTVKWNGVLSVTSCKGITLSRYAQLIVAQIKFWTRTWCDVIPVSILCVRDNKRQDRTLRCRRKFDYCQLLVLKTRDIYEGFVLPRWFGGHWCLKLQTVTLQKLNCALCTNGVIT